MVDLTQKLHDEETRSNGSYEQVPITDEEKVLNDVKTCYWNQYKAVTAVSMGMFLSGLHFGWIGPTLPLLLNENSPITITSEQIPLVSGFLQIGAMPGPIFGSLIADYLGRKPAALFMSLPFFASGLLLMFVRTINYLYVARFLCGLSVGATFAVIPMYICEVSSPKIRGILSMTVGLSINFGILYQFIVAPFVSIQTNAIVATLASVIMFICILFVPETPYYCLMQNDEVNAKKHLKYLRMRDDVDNEFEELKNEAAFERKQGKNIFNLVTIATNRKSLIIICGILIAQQYCGATAIFTYSQVLFERVDTVISAETSGILLAFSNFIVIFVTGYFIDKTGRRSLLIWSCLGSIPPLIALGIFYQLLESNYQHISNISLVPVIAVFIYKFTFSLGLGSIPYICLGELFPTNVKATATSFVSVFGSILGFSVTKMYQVVTDSFGTCVAFYIFAIVCVFSGIFVYVMLPETRGKSLDTIQEELRKSDKK